MSAKILHIQRKNRTPNITVVGLQDFDYREGETIDSFTVVEKSNISLYCLDAIAKRAIFVQTPINIDLSQPPFYYLAQYEHAEKLIAVPFEDLPELVNRLERIEQLITIYSVGRCGSTLLSKVFNQLDTVLSLSEPDVFSQIVGLRNGDRSNDEEIMQLLKACICLLAKQTEPQRFSCCAIKLRGIGIGLGDLIARAFPDAKSIFLYRNAEDVVKSSIRSFDAFSKLLPTIEENIELYSRYIPLLKDYAADMDFTDSRAIDLYTVGWLSKMQSYLSLYEQGIITCAIRYEDLVTKPQKIVTALFEKCNLPVSNLVDVLAVFESDSQDNSTLSRENTRKNESEPLDTTEIRKKIDRLLKKHSAITTPDYIVPDTLGYPG